jgi:hypothetical protein
MLTLADINALPNDPSEEHLRSLGLLPQPAPAPSIIPPAGKIPTPSPVTAPAAAPPTDWRAKLAATVPHAAASATPIPALSPVTAPDLGTAASPEMPATSEAATPGVNFPKLAPLNFKERQALPTTSEGVAPGSKESFESQLARLQDQKANPWGSPENHPGLLGKIGHYAAKIGNIAGDIVAPGTMANIPGTELNRRLEERGLETQIAKAGATEEQKKNFESERELRSAEAKKDIAEAERGPEGKQETPELETIHDMMMGDNGKARINPDTQKPFTYFEAYEAVKKAGQRDPTNPANMPADAKAIADYQERLKSVGMDGTSLATFSSVPPGTTMGELEKRYTDAKSLREMGQKDRENTIRDQERRDAAARSAQEFGEKREERIEAKGQKWVTGEDANGKQVMVPQSQAKEMGLKNIGDADADTQNKTLAARHVVPLLFKNDPSDPGVVQLIDKLDKEGKLGVVASRWNDFLSGTLGAGDPDYTALRTRMGLATTKLMQAHVGSRGGSYMLEHFEDLANAKKLDANTLRAGINQELRYVNDLSMLPSSGSGGKASGGHSFSINGKPYENVPDDVYQRAKQKPGFKE